MVNNIKSVMHAKSNHACGNGCLIIDRLFTNRRIPACIGEVGEAGSCTTVADKIVTLYRAIDNYSS